MQTVTVTWLKSLEVLENVPEDQLQWFIDNSVEQTLEDGTMLNEPGVAMTGPHIILEGGMRFYMLQDGGRREYVSAGVGNITGYLPFSRGIVSRGYAQAIGQLRVLSFPTERIQEMIRNCFELTQALVHIMTTRVRDFTAMQQQNEKMMALGKLSAGLAHELNNPASAIVRDSTLLSKRLRMAPKAIKDMFAVKMDDTQIEGLTDEMFRVLNERNNAPLNLKQRSTLEDSIGEWLDDNEVENAYEIAESFVDFSFGVDNLDVLKKHAPKGSLSTILNWMSGRLTAEKMVEDIQESSKRIADLVNSVKVFTHMDRGQDKQYADIHIGIRNTLTMLGYKLRKGNITIVEDFDETLPEVKALIGELNQVWTNLIDNAIDAMEPKGKGTLTIKTRRDREFVEVFIIDDGPGIPADVQSRIFDPFFTTKEMGKGTGLGLEVVQRIVKQHRGSIKVKSEPGHTEFAVCFLIDG